MPELSNGKQYDTIVFPNVLLMSTNNVLEKMNVFVRAMAHTILNEHKVFKVSPDIRLRKTILSFKLNIWRFVFSLSPPIN